ncbi:MAG: glucosaminidase domain-containing protein [Enterococcus sp.]|uniref:glucosaminidase domain-containing protein n=1 Tax=Enterococcus sp. TaxID=35783 RepID=UPI00264A1AAD|nr:glucosaminidase domain-containing protein [Enterococcus sp.]MDN6003125.1 glucosaminidase domain-containing protein [Enterococcus sp.]MDN6518087.1 glucosaminidase domain-containing protein [Enterococcus sp.]MDN6561349.1 glucosaminidase domain-containing protein [Enterococcus sp.]MDN6777741.1 glucosaminidase domain-containing protein [Enterococcus sp.]
MKRSILGAGLLVLITSTVFSISKGENLKASDEATIDSSQISIETSTQEKTVTSSSKEVLASQKPQSESEPPASKERPALAVETEGSSESEEENNSEVTSSEPTESTSTTSSTTSESSTSTSQSATQPSSSSTSTSQSSSEETSSSSTTSSLENGLEKVPESSTEPASSKEKPVEHPESPSPSVSSKEMTKGPDRSYSDQPSVPTYEPSVPTIGSSDPLGDREVELDEQLATHKVAESDFNGYELPLLSSYTNRNQAILVYEGLRQLGEQGADYSTDTLLNGIFEKLFDQSYKETSGKAIQEKDLEPGDILVANDTEIGLYLGENYYLAVQEKATSEEISEKDSSETAKKEEREKEEKKEVAVLRLSEEAPITGKRLSALTKTDYAEEVEKSYPASLTINPNEQTKKFIEQIGKDAQKLGLKYDVFASVMIAQAILESGSGSSGLAAAPNYNLFGVKGTYNGQSVSMATQEDRGNGDLYTIAASFRRYPGYAESLGDYVTLIRGGISGNGKYYQEVWRSQAKNYIRSAESLTGKYATDTSYHRKISSIIAAYHLTQFDEKLPEIDGTRGGTTTSGLFLQGKDTIPEAYRKKMTLPDYNGKNYNTSGSYPVGQCTWYAFNRVAQLGGHVDDYMGNGGEWGTKGRRLGYEVTSTPKVGYVISFTPGTAGSDPRFGHVAIVEAVTENGILISEGNVVGGTVISYRIIPNELAKSDLVSYIKPK